MLCGLLRFHWLPAAAELEEVSAKKAITVKFMCLSYLIFIPLVKQGLAQMWGLLCVARG